MAGPNGLRPRGALVLENAVSVVDRGRSLCGPIGACVIRGRDRKQKETDETLHEWKNNGRVSHREEGETRG